MANVGPLRGLHAKPMPIGPQAPFKHELGFVLLCRDDANDVFIQASGDLVSLDVRDEAGLVLLLDQLANVLRCRWHALSPLM